MELKWFVYFNFFSLVGAAFTGCKIGSIISRCSGNEPAQEERRPDSRAAEIEPGCQGLFIFGFLVFLGLKSCKSYCKS